MTILGIILTIVVAIVALLCGIHHAGESKYELSPEDLVLYEKLEKLCLSFIDEEKKKKRAMLIIVEDFCIRFNDASYNFNQENYFVIYRDGAIIVKGECLDSKPIAINLYDKFKLILRELIVEYEINKKERFKNNIDKLLDTRSKTPWREVVGEDRLKEYSDTEKEN